MQFEIPYGSMAEGCVNISGCKDTQYFLNSSYSSAETDILEVENWWEREVLELVGNPALPECRFHKCHSIGIRITP